MARTPTSAGYSATSSRPRSSSSGSPASRSSSTSSCAHSSRPSHRTPSDGGGPRRSSAHGATTRLDYFALRRDKNYFFSADGRSLIAYLYVRGTAMVAADPIGPPTDTARTVDEFLAYCAERAWRVAFFAVREADAEIYRARGMHVVYLGDEAILHCDEFSLDGGGMKAVRDAVRHVDRNHDFQLIGETEASPELIAELNEISAEWRAGSPERGFTMELGEDVEGTESDFV